MDSRDAERVPASRAGRRPPILVGERLNPSGNPRLLARLLAGDWDAVDEEAAAQRDAGAGALDVNGALPGAAGAEEDPARLAEMVRRARRASGLAIFVDARGRDALLAGLDAAGPGAVANSITASEADLRDTLPLLARTGAGIVGLAMDERGLPPAAEGRFACAARFVAAGRALGLPDDRLIVDCLAQPGGPDAVAGNAAALDAMRAVRERLGVRLILGVSNVSYRAPGAAAAGRSRGANARFLRAALQAGLDFAIANPLDRAVREALGADFRNIPGRDA